MRKLSLLGILALSTYLSGCMPEIRREPVVRAVYYDYGITRDIFAEWYTDTCTMPDSVVVEESFGTLANDTVYIGESKWVLLKPNDSTKTYERVRLEIGGTSKTLTDHDFYNHCMPKDILRNILHY